MEKSAEENTDYTDPVLIKYLETFNEKDIISLNVARQQLGTSLNLNISNGYNEFKKTTTNSDPSR